MAVRVGIDTGGTFTDVVVLDEAGRAERFKVPSTPDDPARALLEGVSRVGSPIGSVAHGTTVGTNALLQGGASGEGLRPADPRGESPLSPGDTSFHSLALITTRGFRHVLEIARQSVPSGYGNCYFWVKPERIVPLQRVREVGERLDFRGNVLAPLDEDDARAAARWARELGVSAVGICFLHSYANAEHERRMREILLEEHPGCSVSISSEVWPEYREYERTVTTLVDAFIKPHVTGYLERAAAAVGAPLLIMKSNGGVLPASAVARRPIATALSGPAAGALGASWLARQAGLERVITIDTGGTSTDVCLVEGAEPALTREGRIGRFPVRLPMIDIVSVGTGGGSIAWAGPDGGLRVGPKSAGAVPGPMAYGLGGEEPTVTDAALRLELLPAELAGGAVKLDPVLAARGIARLGEQLSLSPERTAAGILEISAHNQANAVLQLTVKRGIDPSGDALVAFGGAGPLQACAIASILGLTTVLIPPSPGNVSAFGLLAVDLKDDYVLTRVRRHDAVDGQEAAEIFAALERAAAASLLEQGVPPERSAMQRSVDARYLGEAHELTIPIANGFDAAAVAAAFHDAHESAYGYAYRSGEQGGAAGEGLRPAAQGGALPQIVELVNWKVTGLGLIERPSLEMPPPTGSPELREGRLRRDSLPAGYEFSGPAIVDEYGSTFVLESGWRCQVDRFGNLVARR